MLRPQEILAINLIFRSENELSKAIKERIDKAESINWEETGIGFYSKIKLKSPLAKVPDIRMWDYNFSHPNFPHGGSFMCTIVGESELELEAVAFGGVDWPYPMDAEQFEELEL
ncbi:hypothetical protein [Vibrio navarrensis]|uniref:hypothetical protein n=1 Tax=Vibrio navarrensis TaxID=29495 RepID=UPI00051D3453|nr:hypothetical protein [Vibrio navarrensis]KGK15417.1 hypothetical protein EA24_07645 [Vibrio navarrensis]